MLKRCMILIMAFVMIALPAMGENTYPGYIYDAWGKSVPAPDSYLPAEVINGVAQTGKAFKSPADVFVHNEEFIYISDAGNGRIVVLDQNFAFVREVNKFFLPDGGEVKFKNPSGIFVDEKDQLYICLPDEGRVVVLDQEDKLVREYGRPDSDLLEENAEFKPDKVLANQLGTVFILPKGMYLGAVMYDRTGKFLGFYGANNVTVSVAVMIDYMWKQLLSQQQVNNMARYVPVQYASFDIDQENFIYTCTNESSNTYNEISKLNSLGDNVLISYTRNVRSQTGNYGDLERGYYMGQTQDTRFIDLAIHDNGMLYALDRTRGRVFVYDQESHLLSVFGGAGYQEGTFQNAIAIDTLGQKVLVLDKDKASMTVFERTEYGELVESAVLLYIDGLYQEAWKLWEEVAQRNVNCELAYIGIGKALYEEGRYQEAMHYFKLGYDREGYSRAFNEYRMETARNLLPYVFTVLLVGGAGLVIFTKIRKYRAIREGRREEE
ncbi:MAG: hypothetical protein E7324_04355 [Clostridiales bacterium]|nr:hypothetical protein [Clostridiales bacterium]